MILFCNTFITEAIPPGGKGFVFRENLKTFSNFDIFKYSLASLAVAYPWKKVILKIELDPIYKPRQQELEDFIKDEFQNFDLILNWERNYLQSEWKNDYELLDDDLIWFYCNHDHIFLDSSTKYLEDLVEKMRGEKLCSLQFSHYPENIRTAPMNFSTYKEEDTYLSVVNENLDSIQIITKDLYYNWWCDGELGDVTFPRPDYFGRNLSEYKKISHHKMIIPLKEICRHFDGYQHVQPIITNNQCPAIDIPPGFFENNIKIRYGYDDYKEGWVNINPKNDYYYAHNTSGTDYKFTLEDLPLVWKSRISFVDSHTDMNEEEMIQYRLKSIMEMVYTSNVFQIDDSVVSKILGQYLSNFNYTIDD